MLTDEECRLRALDALHEERLRNMPSPAVLIAAEIVLRLTEGCGMTMCGYSVPMESGFSVQRLTI